MSRLSLLVLSLTLALALGVSGLAVEAEGMMFLDRPARVRVSVHHDDESTENMIGSYLKRELRDLSDVEVVQEDEDYRIGVVALTVTTRGGEELGTALSFLVERRTREDCGASCQAALGVCPRDPESPKDLLIQLAQDICNHVGTSHMSTISHQVISVSREKLKETFENFVAYFDGDNLEEYREEAQRLRDVLNSQ
jgi:hypothetical protein